MDEKIVITIDSPSRDVQSWFEHPENERFSKHAGKFIDLNGADVLGLSKEDMEYMGLPRYIIPALWNALHPPDVDVMDIDMKSIQFLVGDESLELENEHNRWFFCNREETILQVFNFLQDSPVLLVSAPPGSGKTSLAQLFARYIHLNEKGNAYYVKCDPSRNYAYHPRHIVQELKGNTADYLIIDESQITYDMSVDVNRLFWDDVKSILDQWNLTNNPTLKILLFSGYGSSKRVKVGNATPLDSNCLYFEDVLRYKSSEIQSVFNSFFQYRSRQDIEIPVEIFDNIFVRVEGHPGYLSIFLKYLEDILRKYPKLFESSFHEIMYNQDLYTKLLDFRATPDLNALRFEFIDDEQNYPLKDSCSEILLNLVKNGSLVVNTPIFRMAAHILAINGMVSEQYDTLNQGVLVKFTCFIQRHLTYMKLCGSINRAESLEYLSGGITQFVLNCVKRFSRDTLQNGTFNADGCISEDMFQKEFFRVSTQLTPLDIHIHPENGKLKLEDSFHIDTSGNIWVMTNNTSSVSAGKPDFYINSNLQWLIEFLVGKSANAFHEHLDRFLPNGDYYSQYTRQFLVVWFLKKEHVPDEGVPTTHELYPNSLVIIYDTKGFEWIFGSESGYELFSCF